MHTPPPRALPSSMSADEVRALIDAAEAERAQLAAETCADEGANAARALAPTRTPAATDSQYLYDLRQTAWLLHRRGVHHFASRGTCLATVHRVWRVGFGRTLTADEFRRADRVAESLWEADDATRSVWANGGQAA